MLRLLSIGLFFLAQQLCGQNLVVNGDFEAPGANPEHMWSQPEGEYFHYEIDTSGSGKAYSGLYYNGICMYKGLPSEYLQIKLAEKLEAGQEYCVRMWARLHPGKATQPEGLKAIEVVFSTREADVSAPFPDIRKPDVSLPLTLDSNLFDWQLLEAKYTARGNEEVLVMGHFLEAPPPMPKPKQDTIAKQLYSMNALYFGGAAAKRNKQTRKQTKQLKEEMERLRQLRTPAPVAKPQRLSSSYPGGGQGTFRVRYYFDEICLAPLSVDGTCACDDEEPVATYVVGDKIEMRNIFFETAKWDILPRSDTEIRKLFDLLSRNPEMQIRINGHTDSRGSIEFNRELSLNRAKAVTDELIQLGIRSERLSYKGFGPEQPIASNDSAEGRARNRRVEFEILTQ